MEKNICKNGHKFSTPKELCGSELTHYCCPMLDCDAGEDYERIVKENELCFVANVHQPYEITGVNRGNVLIQEVVVVASDVMEAIGLVEDWIKISDHENLFVHDIRCDNVQEIDLRLEGE